MKKRLISICVCCAMLLLMLPAGVLGVTAAPVAADTSWYSDSAAEFTLADAADVLGFAQLLAGGNTFAGKTLLLGADVDLNPGYTGEQTAPETVWPDVSGKAFSGVFDGQGHSISGLYMNGKSAYAGFFGYASGGTAEAPVTVKNLGLLNAYIDTDQQGVGGVFGKTEADSVVQIEAVYVDANVFSNLPGTAENRWIGYLGGFVGLGEGGSKLTIADSAFVGLVYAGGDVRPAGGLIGEVKCELVVTNCAGYGAVNTAGNNVSAIAGCVENTGSADISDCVALGDVKGATFIADTKWVGALIGGVKNDKTAVSNSIYADVFYSGGELPEGEDYVSIDVPYGDNTDSPVCKPVVEGTLVHLTDAEKDFWLGDAVAEDLAAAGLSESWTVIDGAYPLPNAIKDFPAVVPEIPQEQMEYDLSWYEGHEEDASYVLSDAADLLGFSYLIATGVTFEGKTLTMDADIEVNPGYTGGTMAPANHWYNTAGKAFSGVFDGAGHVISGVYLETAGEATGLFGNAVGGTEEAPVTVKNLAVINSRFAGNHASLGVLFGEAQAEAVVSVDSVYICANLSPAAGGRVGGLIGAVVGAQVSITNSAYDGELVIGSDVREVGALVGQIINAAVSEEQSIPSAVTMENCAVYGKVQTGGNQVGGLLGRFHGGTLDIDHCVFMGSLTPASWANDDKWLGAFIGRFDADGITISNSIYCDVNHGDGSRVDLPYGVGDPGWAFVCTTENLLHIEDADLEGWIGEAVQEDLETVGITGWATLETAGPLPEQIVEFSPDYVAEYTVTWDVNGVITTETYKEGETPEYPGEDDPTRPDDENYTYLFHGWDPEITPVTADVTYTAKWLQVPIQNPDNPGGDESDDSGEDSNTAAPGGDDSQPEGSGTDAATEPEEEGCASGLHGAAAMAAVCTLLALTLALRPRRREE